MFNLSLLLDIAEGRPGMLIPVFSSPNTNIPYVQQMDEFMLVKEIVPFLEYENYSCLPYSDLKTVNIGDKGVIAFRSFDDEIVCGDFEEILDYIAKNQERISKDRVLKLQLQRIESAELNPSYELWRQTASELFSDEKQAKFWVDSELQLFQKQKKIWSDIDPIDSDDPSVGDGLNYTSLTEYGTEYLLRWLGNRTNYSAKNWTKIWHYVHEKLPFDDRVSQIATSWMYSFDEDSDLQQSKSIIFALLQGWSLFGKDYPDYADFLSDRIATDPSLLFGFLRPRKLISQLLEYLSARGNPDDAIKILNFATTDFPKEDFVLDAIRSALAIIAWQVRKHDGKWIASTHTSDFEQRHRDAARILWLRLAETFPTDEMPWAADSSTQFA